MDKYIKMLIIKLSPRYKVTVGTQMSFNPETTKFTTACWIKIIERETDEKTTIDCHGKREVISELIKWLHD